MNVSIILHVHVHCIHIYSYIILQSLCTCTTVFLNPCLSEAHQTTQLLTMLSVQIYSSSFAIFVKMWYELCTVNFVESYVLDKHISLAILWVL